MADPADVEELLHVTEHGEERPTGTRLRKTLACKLTAAMPTAVKSRGLTTIMLAPTLAAEEIPKIRPLYVLGFLHFKEKLDVASIQNLFKDRLCEIPRFRAVPKIDADGAYIWEQQDPETLDMPALVQELSGVKTPEHLNEWCENFYTTDLAATLPLWRAFICNGMSDGRNLLIFAVNHAVADGTSLIASLLAVLDDRDASSPVKTRVKRQVARPGFFQVTRATMGALFNTLIGDHLPGDPSNRLKVADHRNPGSDIAVGMSDKIELAMVKQVAERYPGATVNDVLMTVVTLTLRMYFERYQPEVLKSKQSVRANFPISLRAQDANALEDENFGNVFSQGILQFPVEKSETIEMLHGIKQQIDTIKISPEPYIRRCMINGVAGSGIQMETVWNLVLDMYGKVTVMLSNVVGPHEEAYMDNKPIDELSFYALAPLGFYIGLVSYCGKISCGITVRKSCEPDIKRMTSLWVPAFEKLYSESLSFYTVPPWACCSS